jgi:hypothetical protein
MEWVFQGVAAAGRASFVMACQKHKNTATLKGPRTLIKPLSNGDGFFVIRRTGNTYLWGFQRFRDRNAKLD